MHKKDSYSVYLKILLVLTLFTQTVSASMDNLLSVYIPVTHPQSELMDKDGITLHKALFYTFYSEPESAVGAITWKYIVNTPHKRQRLQNMNINLANLNGLKVELHEYGSKECSVVIDSSEVVSTYSSKELNKLLSYVKKATKLNMKEYEIHCPITEVKATRMVNFLPLPQALNLEKSAVQTLSKYKSGFKEAPFVNEIFYPLGYSEDGKIAYIKEYDTDPADIVLIRTFVQDLVTDKILWKDEFRVENEITGVNFKSFWAKKSTLISKKLSEYGIQSFKNLHFKNETYLYGKETFSLNSETTSSFQKDWGTAFLDSSTIILSAKGKGQKVIDRRHYKDEQLLARKAIGFIPLSKSADRVAVVVANVHRGWEGPPHNLGYEIVGASLKIGFKK